MLRNNRALFALLLTVLMLSCDKTPQNPDKVLWGTTNHYTDFLFKKYEPVIMTKTLEFDFNEDAQRLVHNDILFEPVEKEENGKFISAKGIVLYKNGQKCKDNILNVKSNEKSIELGIEFTGDALEGNHTLFLRVKNSGGLDRIDNTELSSSDNVILAHEWVVKKVNVYNPLAKCLFWVLIFILVILAVWRILIRPMVFEVFKVKTIYFFYPEVMKTVRLRGCRRVVCSKNKQSQSFFSRFFTGKIIYVQNDFWEQDVEIIPRDKKSVKVRVPRDFSIMPSSTLVKGTDTEIKNSTKLIKLQIQ